MKRERVSDSEESDVHDNNSITSADATAPYGIYNPGYSFVRPPVAQSKPNPKRPRVGDGNTTTGNVPVKSEPGTERFRELSIRTEPEEDLYGLEPRIGPSRRSSSNVRDIQTPKPNIPILPDVRTPSYKSHLPDVQTQPLVQRPRENNRPSITGNGSSEYENPIVSIIKEKLHNAILGLTSEEPKPSENPPPWGKHFALSGSSSKLVNPALTIYGLGGIGLPLSERDAGLIAKVNPPDPDTKPSNAIVDLTDSKITELSPYQLETTNPGWEKAVEVVVAKVTKKLKVPGGPANVGFLPSSMTLYGSGDMLKEHRGPIKGPGVFGTLAICLPSKHEGGDLIVTHGDQVKVLSTASQSAFGYSYLFWYTNLTCELTEVSQGIRLVLMYDLVKIDSDGPENVPDAPTSFWQKMDQLESTFRLWKSKYTEQASSCPKFLAYTLDNTYDEHNLSRAILQGDDYQRVNGLLQLCKRHGFVLYLAKLQLQAGRETRSPTEKLLELQHVVQLDGTKVFDVAPLSASDIVQNNIFSDSLNNGSVSDSIGNNGANSNQENHRFAVMLMPAESCVEFYFGSLRSSATDMADWICKLTAACIASNENDSAKVDLRIACLLVIEDVKHWRDTRNTMPRDPEKCTSAMDSLLGIVIRGGIFLNDQTLCGEALYEVSSEIPVPAVVEALNHFGFGNLLCDLDKTICRFKHMYQDFRAFLKIHDRYRRYNNSTALTNLVAWMKPRALETFARTHLKYKEDGEKAAKVGIICGETYLKEELLPAIILDILRDEKPHGKKPVAVFRFLTAIADGQRGGKIELATAQHVFSSVLRVFTPRIQIVPFRTQRGGVKNDSISVKAEDILHLVHQCVSLELRRHVGLLFGKLDAASIGQSAIILEGLFLPLINSFDEMPPGQIPGTVTQEFHFLAHQLVEKLRKLHPFLFTRPRRMSPRPQRVTSQPQQLGSMRFPEEELDCTCKDCLKFAAFVEDHTTRSVKFSFGTESRIAHYKTYQLHQIAKGGFQHTCTIIPAENGGVGSYSVTIRKTKTQFAMGNKKATGAQTSQKLQLSQHRRSEPQSQGIRFQPPRPRPLLS